MLNRQGHKALRGCLRSNAIAREMLLSLAGKRLKSMAHVGLTERLQESVLSMAADLGKGWMCNCWRVVCSAAA
jgi:hypothetical protein